MCISKLIRWNQGKNRNTESVLKPNAATVVCPTHLAVFRGFMNAKKSRVLSGRGPAVSCPATGPSRSGRGLCLGGEFRGPFCRIPLALLAVKLLPVCVLVGLLSRQILLPVGVVPCEGLGVPLEPPGLLLLLGQVGQPLDRLGRGLAFGLALFRLAPSARRPTWRRRTTGWRMALR